jgi:pilus assembly protein CpaF
MVKIEIINEVLLDTLRPIAAFLNDSSINEIMVNPGGAVWIERAGALSRTDVTLDENTLEIAIQTLAKRMGKDATPHTASAVLDASFDDMRIAASLTPTSFGGSMLCVRKHMDHSQRPTFSQLIAHGALTRQQADRIEELFIAERKNLIVAGATSSGKTTFTNALLGLIPDDQRVVSIEDTKELSVTVPNYVQLIANKDQGITARRLVQLAMRMRPDRIVLGETRGEETYDLIRAFNSGHDGSISTVHASNARMALGALEMLIQMSVPENASLSADVVRQYIASCVHVVVFVHRTDGVRRVKEIAIVKGVKQGEYDIEYA